MVQSFLPGASMRGRQSVVNGVSSVRILTAVITDVNISMALDLVCANTRGGGARALMVELA
jgi:hypothetical protein